MTATALQFLIAADAGICLDYGKTTQAFIAGLTKISAPGFSREVITIDEFRNEFARQFSGGGKYNDISFGGNLVVGDHDGQQKMKGYAYNKTKLVGRDMLCFLDLTNFFTTDLANDPSSSMQIADVASGEVGKNDAFPISGKILPNGRLAIYTAHLVEDDTVTTAFVNGVASNDTITDSANRFVTAGFVAGQTLLIFDSTSNDAIATTIKTVAAGVLTLNSIGLVTAEAGIEGMELHGGAL